GAGVIENFAANTELDELRAALRDDRMLAAQLATANEDFALAEVILMAAPLGDQARQTELAAVNAARGARLRRHAEQIETALADIRQGLWRSGRPVSAPRLDDYVFRLSSFREPQTVNLLEQALNNYTRKAAAPAAGLWTQTERDEITLICRVLASLELPEVAIPPLVDFLRVIRDDRLTIECAEALCLTGNVAAYTPLVELRARVKPASFVWYRVRGYFPRVPEPDPPPPAETAEQLLDRAVLRREQNLTEAAAADIKAAYTLAPDMPRAITAFGTTFLNTSEAKPHYDRAIALKPDFAPAWRERGLWNFRNGNVEQALADLDQAIALDAADASALSMKGFVLGSTQRHEEALEVTLRATELWPWHAPFWANVGAYALNSRQYDRAVAACSRAIELDPRQQEAWVNRGAAKNALGDHDGALADFTRVLEFSPGYAWGYYNRAHIHRARKDFEAAIYDYTQALERTSANYLRESLLYRARCYRELKRYEPALEDLRAFRQTLTDPERQAAVDAEIAEVEALLKPGE
ncbi:MAG: tetratricopeptide repeat protein, partial [Planctomycetes bacterium]|nr:tetratricopeptide repeat protein [Planctomycetota bacterium]